MNMSRRFFCSSAGAATAIGLTNLSTTSAWAGTSIELGTIRLDTLSDGNLVLPGDFVLGMAPQGELSPILDRYGIARAQLEPPCNVTLLRDGDRTVIFDVGSGSDFQPSVGKLPEALETLGVDPSEITHVVFTHCHADHIWGLLDDFDEPLFSEAAYLIGKTEWDYWIDPNTVDTIGADRAGMAVGAKRRLEYIEDNVSFFRDGEEILPGIAARATFGHTPGHMSFEVRSGSESTMIVGDAISNHYVAFERPEWLFGNDQDVDMAVGARLSLLDQVATEQMQLVGFHLPGGGMGRAERLGGAYQFVPSEG